MLPDPAKCFTPHPYPLTLPKAGKFELGGQACKFAFMYNKSDTLLAVFSPT